MEECGIILSTTAKNVINNALINPNYLRENHRFSLRSLLSSVIPQAEALPQIQPSIQRSIHGPKIVPGVGRKTASVVLNTAFGEPTIAVDTHIFRVSNRTGLAKGKTPLEVELRLTKLTPEEFRQDAHHWLILHGRYTCKARKPGCPGCVINDLCEYRKKTREEAA